MSAIQNLTIGQRLGAGFGVFLALMALLLGMALTTQQNIARDLRAVVEQDERKIRLTTLMENTLLQKNVAVRNIGLLAEVAPMQEEAARIEALDRKYKELAAELESLPLDDEEKKLLATVTASQADAAQPTQAAVDMALAFFGDETIKILNNEVAPVQNKWIAALRDLVVHEEQTAQQRAESAGQASDRAITLMLIIGAVALVLGFTIAIVISRSITRPLTHAVALAKRVAAGDLTASIAVHTRDETGQLLQTLQTMTDSLREIARNVRASAGAITEAAGEIALGSRDLAQRTEEQAANLEETSSSMEELTGTVKQNAGNSKQADRLAAQAADVAIKGGEIVEQAMAKMGLITASSNKIAEIVGVIEGIAFQTNILSLNAAVEAARAGEQGRGFAVVAAEVRSLAERAATAAKEVKALIDDSVAKVEEGAKLVQQAGVTMSEVVGSVKTVSGLIAEIAVASDEQSGGIEQVNQAIVQMDQVTQRNAALVEETAASGATLEEQALRLNAVVNVFRIGGEGVPAPQGAVPVPAFPTMTQPAVTAASGGNGQEPKPKGGAEVVRWTGSMKRVPERPAALSRETGHAAAARSDDWREF